MLCQVFTQLFINTVSNACHYSLGRNLGHYVAELLASSCMKACCLGSPVQPEGARLEVQVVELVVEHGWHVGVRDSTYHRSPRALWGSMLSSTKSSVCTGKNWSWMHQNWMHQNYTTSRKT